MRERDYRRFLDSERAAAGGVMALDSDPRIVAPGTAVSGRAASSVKTLILVPKYSKYSGIYGLLHLHTVVQL